MCCQDWEATLDIRPSLTGGYFDPHAFERADIVAAGPTAAKSAAKLANANACWAARAAYRAVDRAIYMPRDIVIDDKRYLVPTLKGLEMYKFAMGGLRATAATASTTSEVNGDDNTSELDVAIKTLVTMGHLVPQQV